MAYNVSNQEYSGSKKSKLGAQPSRFNKVSTTEVDINEDLNQIASERSASSTDKAASTDDTVGVSQRLINEVRSQSEAVLSQIRTLAKDYGLEVTALRGQVVQTMRSNPGAVVLGAACVGFCAGYLAKGIMSKPAAK